MTTTSQQQVEIDSPAQSLVVVTQRSSSPKDFDSQIDNIRGKLRKYYHLRFGLASLAAALYLLIDELSDEDIFNIFLAPVFATLSFVMSGVRWYALNRQEYYLSSNKNVSLFSRCVMNFGFFIAATFALTFSLGATILYLNTIVSIALAAIYLAKLTLKLSQCAIWFYRAMKAEPGTDRQDECWGRAGKYGSSAAYCLAVLIGIALSFFLDGVTAGTSKTILSCSILGVAAFNTFYDEIKLTVRSWFRVENSKKSWWPKWSKKETPAPAPKSRATFLNEMIDNQTLSDRAKLLKMTLFKAIEFDLRNLMKEYVLSNGKKVSEIESIEYSSLYFRYDEIQTLRETLEAKPCLTQGETQVLQEVRRRAESNSAITQQINAYCGNLHQFTETLIKWHKPGSNEGRFGCADLKISLESLKSYCTFKNQLDEFSTHGLNFVTAMLDKKIDSYGQVNKSKKSFFFSAKQKNDDKLIFLQWLREWIAAPSDSKPNLRIKNNIHTISSLNDLSNLFNVDASSISADQKETYNFFMNVFSSSFESKGEVETLLKFVGYFIKITPPQTNTKALPKTLSNTSIAENSDLPTPTNSFVNIYTLLPKTIDATYSTPTDGIQASEKTASNQTTPPGSPLSLHFSRSNSRETLTNQDLSLHNRMQYNS